MRRVDGNMHNDSLTTVERGQCARCGSRDVVWGVTRRGAKIMLEARVRTVVMSDGVHCLGREAHIAFCRQPVRAANPARVLSVITATGDLVRGTERA